jgi:hypothetical protein
MTLASVLLVQWCLLMFLTMFLVTEYGSPTAEDAQIFDLAYWVIVSAIVLALIGEPLIRAIPDGYRYAKDKLGDYA